MDAWATRRPVLERTSPICDRSLQAVPMRVRGIGRASNLFRVEVGRLADRDMLPRVGHVAIELIEGRLDIASLAGPESGALFGSGAGPVSSGE
jgi:hypothetical protein